MVDDYNTNVYVAPGLAQIGYALTEDMTTKL